MYKKQSLQFEEIEEKSEKKAEQMWKTGGERTKSTTTAVTKICKFSCDSISTGAWTAAANTFWREKNIIRCLFGSFFTFLRVSRLKRIESLHKILLFPWCSLALVRWFGVYSYRSFLNFHLVSFFTSFFSEICNKKNRNYKQLHVI